MTKFDTPVSVPRGTSHMDHGTATATEYRRSKYKCEDPRNVNGLLVRCRHCSSCLRSRQYSWAFRSLLEIWSAQRTWWLTLTLRPGAEFSSYSAVQQYLYQLRKTLRGTQRAKFRYLFAEEGDNHTTRHHFHAFIHGTPDLTRRDIETSWQIGHSKCILLTCDASGKHSHHPSNIDWNDSIARRAFYVAKYASKAGRVRASTRYGQGTPASQLGITSTIVEHPPVPF